MTIIRSGATRKYASNWNLVFGHKPRAKAVTEATKSASAAKKTPKKKSAPAKSNPAKSK